MKRVGTAVTWVLVCTLMTIGGIRLYRAHAAADFDGYLQRRTDFVADCIEIGGDEEGCLRLWATGYFSR